MINFEDLPLPSRDEMIEALVPPRTTPPPILPRWAAVRSVNPLRVQMVGDSTQVDATPESLEAGLVGGDLVWTALTDRGALVVVGRAEGGSLRSLEGVEWLDVITTVGNFYQPTDAGAAAGSDYPEDRAGTLEVLPWRDVDGQTNLLQRYSTWTGNTWTRFLIFNDDWSGWTPWRHVGGPGTDWQAVSFASGVGNYATGYGPCQYRVTGTKLEMRGLLRITSARSGTSVDDTLFTLPVGARPTYNRIVAAVMNQQTGITGPASTGTAHTHLTFGTSGTPVVAVRLDVLPSGHVGTQVLASNGSWSMPVDSWISLDNAVTWLD